MWVVFRVGGATPARGVAVRPPRRVGEEAAGDDGRGHVAGCRPEDAGAVSVVRDELAGIRTGRANAKILDRVSVDYYGTKTPLNQLASFSVPEPRLLVIQPFDKNAMGAMEKAIMQSDLG